MRLASIMVVAVLFCVRCESTLEDQVDNDAGGVTELPALVADAQTLLAQSRGTSGDPGPHIVVAGVARHGARIGILVRTGLAPVPRLGSAVTNRILLSDDNGSTFRELPLTQTPTDVAMYIALADERTAVIFQGEGARYSVAEVAEDGTLGPMEFIGSTPINVSDSVVTSYLDGGIGSLTIARRDLTTGVQTTHTATLPDRACTLWLFDRDVDGAWRRFCYTATERCVDTIDPEGVGVASTEFCISAADWAIPQRLAQSQHNNVGGVSLVYGSGGHSYALRARDVTDAEIPEAIDLGPGRVTNVADNYFVLEAWAGAEGGPRFVEVGENGEPRDLSFALSPCVDPAECGQTASVGQLVSAVPVDAQRWLAIYVVSSDGEDRLVVRSVGANDVDIRPISEGGADAYRQPREPVIATGALELACARAMACSPGVLFHSCLDYWQDVNGASADADESYAAFVATDPSDCEAFRSTWPEEFPPRTPICEDACIGDVAFQCDSRLTFVIDCARRGTTCRMENGQATCGPDVRGATCGVCDASNRGVQCLDEGVTSLTDCAALGLLCFDDPEQPESPTCTVGPLDGCSPASPICDGNILNSCASDGNVRDRIDCSRIEMGCRAGECEPIGQDAPACDNSYNVRCDGTALVYCLGGENRHLDCTSIGYDSCYDGPVVIGMPSRAWCVASSP